MDGTAIQAIWPIAHCLILNFHSCEFGQCLSHPTDVQTQLAKFLEINSNIIDLFEIVPSGNCSAIVILKHEVNGSH